MWLYGFKWHARLHCCWFCQTTVWRLMLTGLKRCSPSLSRCSSAVDLDPSSAFSLVRSDYSSPLVHWTEALVELALAVFTQLILLAESLMPTHRWESWEWRSAILSLDDIMQKKLCFAKEEENEKTTTGLKLQELAGSEASNNSEGTVWSSLSWK